MASPDITYLVFDTESIADAALVAKLRYAGEARNWPRPCGAIAPS